MFVLPLLLLLLLFRMLSVLRVVLAGQPDRRHPGGDIPLSQPDLRGRHCGPSAVGASGWPGRSGRRDHRTGDPRCADFATKGVVNAVFGFPESGYRPPDSTGIRSR